MSKREGEVMKKELLYGVSGLLVGAAVAGAIVWAVMDSEKAETDQTVSHNMGVVEGKVGDEFDKAYLDSMISHHQMALEMAEKAGVSAKHTELKTAASQIIQTQSKEIEQMQAWQVAWGYNQSNDVMSSEMHMHY
jgi:uncharacterized protein (DUF305 family)